MDLDKLELGFKVMSIRLAEEWIRSNFIAKDFGKYGEKINNEKFVKAQEFTQNYKVNPNSVTQNSKIDIHDFKKFYHRIKTNSDLLVQILLRQWYFTYHESKKIVESMINAFEYYCYNPEIFINNIKNTNFFLILLESNLPLVCVSIPKLMSKFGVVKLLLDESTLILAPFFHLLSEICKNDNIQFLVYQVLEKPLDHYKINKGIALVFDDADINSAVEKIIKGAFGYKARVLTTISHLFIQESIFEEVVQKLKFRGEALKIGSKLDIRTEISTENIFSAPDIAELSNLIIKLDENIPYLRYFINVDPNETIGEDVSGLVIKPFRTISEAIEISNRCNDLQYTPVASVWTNKISVANKVAFELSMSTIWINSLGKYHASIPVGSRQSFFIYFDLHNSTTQISHDSTESECDVSMDKLHERYFRFDIKSAEDNAAKVLTKKYFLNKKSKYVDPNYSFFKTIGRMNVSLTCIPSVYFIVIDIKDFDSVNKLNYSQILTELIIANLNCGNSVIVLVEDETMLNSVCQIFYSLEKSNEYIPQYKLNVVSYKMYSMNNIFDVYATINEDCIIFHHYNKVYITNNITEFNFKEINRNAFCKYKIVWSANS